MIGRAAEGKRGRVSCAQQVASIQRAGRRRSLQAPVALLIALALSGCGGSEADLPASTGEAASPAGATGAADVGEGSEQLGAEGEIAPFTPEPEAQAAYELAFDYVVALKERDAEAACALEDEKAAKNTDPDAFWCDNYDAAYAAVEGQLEAAPSDVGPGYVEFNSLDTGQSIQLTIGNPYKVTPQDTIYEARAIDG
jgi:hypothetical protein